jgi:hypothetical protein
MKKERLANGHEYYLKRLVERLDTIGEKSEYVEWIMQDGIWMPGIGLKRAKLCDLILVYMKNDMFPDYPEGYGIPVELKGNPDKKRKAVAQIDSGRDFIHKCLGLPSPFGKFVVYNAENDRYSYDVIRF